MQIWQEGCVTGTQEIRMQRKLVERELTPEGPRRCAGVAPRRRSVTVNLAESPLGWLHAHGHLNDRLFDAGERLRADYERAQIAPGVTMRWEPVRIGGLDRSGKLVLKLALDRVADFYGIG